VRRHDSRLVLLNMAWLAAMAQRAHRQLPGPSPELIDSHEIFDGRQQMVAGGFVVSTLVIALIISLFSPSGGIWALLLNVSAQIIAGRLCRKTARIAPNQRWEITGLQ
jgi:hypothetical protein